MIIYPSIAVWVCLWKKPHNKLMDFFVFFLFLPKIYSIKIFSRLWCLFVLCFSCDCVLLSHPSTLNGVVNVASYLPDAKRHHFALSTWPHNFCVFYKSCICVFGQRMELRVSCNQRLIWNSVTHATLMHIWCHTIIVKIGKCGRCCFSFILRLLLLSLSLSLSHIHFAFPSVSSTFSHWFFSAPTIYLFSTR